MISPLTNIEQSQFKELLMNFGAIMLNYLKLAAVKAAAKTIVKTSMLSIVTISSNNALAQIYNGYQDNRGSDNSYVVIYQDCNFRGESRVVPVGKYRTMKKLGFGNDKLSSIRVPDGFEATIYEDDGFDGPFARIDRDISCFDKQWNDEVSSIKVINKFGPNRNNSGADESYQGSNNSSQYSDDNVTSKNISQVVFENRVLQQVNERQWQIADARYGVAQYQETSRDSSSVYLQNDFTDEKIRIDLFANDVTFVGGDGRTQRYSIQRKQARQRSVLSQEPTTESELFRVGQNGCFQYTAYTRGGEGGLRFHGKKGFERFSKKPQTGRICHDGVLTMEIDKRVKTTDVIVEIQGRKIRFLANETPTSFKNEWYRKLVRLNVQARR